MLLYDNCAVVDFVCVSMMDSVKHFVESNLTTEFEQNVKLIGTSLSPFLTEPSLDDNFKYFETSLFVNENL